MQTYTILITVDGNTQQIDIEMSDESHCELVQKMRMTEPERHSEAVAAFAAEQLLQAFAVLG